jgi:hypothetical protein
MDDTTGPRAAGQSKPIESPIGYADIDLLDLNWRYRKTLCALLRAGDGSTRWAVYRETGWRIMATSADHLGALVELGYVTVEPSRFGPKYSINATPILERRRVFQALSNAIATEHSGA